jgi:hypothetical protein
MEADGRVPQFAGSMRDRGIVPAIPHLSRDFDGGRLPPSSVTREPLEAARPLSRRNRCLS